MAITLAGPVEIQSGQVCLLENVQSGTYICLAGTKAAAWPLTEEWQSSRWTVEIAADGTYTFKNGYNNNYLTPPSGNNGAQLDTLPSPHAWRPKPGSKPGSFMFESTRYPDMNIDLNFGSANANTKVSVFKTKTERPPHRSWYLKIATGYPVLTSNSSQLRQKEEEIKTLEQKLLLLAEKEEVIKKQEEKLAQLKEKEEVIQKQEKELAQLAEKDEVIQKQETELARLKSQMTERLEEVGKQGGEAEVAKSRILEMEQELKRREVGLSEREEELKRREADIQEQKHLISKDNSVSQVTGESSQFEAELLQLRERCKSLEEEITALEQGRQNLISRDGFVHSQTVFDLTETGPKANAGWKNFMHLKRL